MNKFFIDTGYIIGLEASDDQSHEKALEHWKELSKQRPILVTTSYVFDEIITFFNSRNRHAKAVEIGNRLLNSPSVQFIHVDKALFYETWLYFKQHSDKSYSLTDCMSFVIMAKHNILNALTFDKHFVQAGFKKFPEI